MDALEFFATNRLPCSAIKLTQFAAFRAPLAYDGSCPVTFGTVTAATA